MAQRKRRIASPLPYLWGFAQGFAGVYVVDERGNERVGGVSCRLCSQDGEIPDDVLDFRG